MEHSMPSPAWQHTEQETLDDLIELSLLDMELNSLPTRRRSPKIVYETSSGGGSISRTDRNMGTSFGIRLGIVTPFVAHADDHGLATGAVPNTTNADAVRSTGEEQPIPIREEELGEPELPRRLRDDEIGVLRLLWRKTRRSIGILKDLDYQGISEELCDQEKDDRKSSGAFGSSSSSPPHSPKLAPSAAYSPVAALTSNTGRREIDVIDAVMANRSAGAASEWSIKVAPGASLGGGVGGALRGMDQGAEESELSDLYSKTIPVRTERGLLMPLTSTLTSLSEAARILAEAAEASASEESNKASPSNMSDSPQSLVASQTQLAKELEVAQSIFDEAKTTRDNSVDATRLAVIQRSFDAFVQLDKDQDHMIGIKELERGLKLLEPYRTFNKNDIENIFKTADTTQSGRLHFAEFYSIFACLALLEHRFGLYAGETHLTPLQVKAALRQAGLSPSDAQLRHMFHIRDNSGKLVPRDHIAFPQILQIYLAAPRTEGELFLHSWYQAGRTTFLHHRQHAEASPLQDLLAGTAAGVALTIVGHPFDTVKVRMQTTTRFNSARDVVRKTISREGPLALFKGMGSPMATVPAINAVVFASYAQGRDFFTRRHLERRELSLMEITLAGSYAGLVNSVIVSPVELVKTRLQIQYGEGTKVFSGPVDCIRHILKASGVKGLFRGLAATVYREVPGYAGQFFFYESMKRQLMTIGNRAEAELSSFDLLFAGGMAGMGSWICSYPMDYVKSQIQSEPYNRPTRFKKNPYLFDGGFFSCWKQTVREKGFRELWKGFGVCLMRAWPANAAGFLAYETTLSLIRNHNI